MSLPRQIIKFSLVGSLAAAVDFGGYLILTRGFSFFEGNPVVASVITSTIAVSVAFLNNRRWTFRATGPRWSAAYLRYLVVYGMGIVWQNSILYFLITWQNVPDWIAKVMAILVVAFCWNFVLAKFWVFGYTRTTSSNP